MRCGGCVKYMDGCDCDLLRVGFVDGSYPSRVRSFIGVAPGAASNRVGRAVRESATFQRRDW